MELERNNVGQPDAHTLAVQQLFLKHRARLMARILKWCPNFRDAEDVLQETFREVTKQARTFNLDSAPVDAGFIAWAGQIGRYKLLEALHRANKAPLLSAEQIEEFEMEVPAEDSSEEALSLLKWCMEKLPEHFLRVLRLRYFEKLGPTHIALKLARTVGSVNVSLSKARDLLRHCLQRQLQQD